MPGAGAEGMREAAPPLVVHIIYALDTGGLENGLVNIINRSPPDRYRHAIVCLTKAGPFARRLTAGGRRGDRAAQAPGARPRHVLAALARPAPAAPGHRAHPQPGGAGNPGAGAADAGHKARARRARAGRARPRGHQPQVPPAAPGAQPADPPLYHGEPGPGPLAGRDGAHRAAQGDARSTTASITSASRRDWPTPPPPACRPAFSRPVPGWSARSVAWPR